MAMTFDIITITQEEYEQLNAVQKNLLRTAQQKKNALDRKLESDLIQYKQVTYRNSADNSSLYNDNKTKLTADNDNEINVIREQLQYDMAVAEAATNIKIEEDGYLYDFVAATKPPEESAAESVKLGE